MGKRTGASHGFPVLAYHSSNAAAPWQCDMLFKHSSKPTQATICLRFSLAIDGFVDRQSVVFQIDFNNLNHHNSSMHHPVDIHLTQERLDYIKRRLNSPHVETRTLSLSLKKPCPTWCPKSWRFITPVSAPTTPFGQLTAFAKATNVHIVFDLNRLHATSQRPFLERFLKGGRNLAGFPVADRYPEHELVDLKTFDVDDPVGTLPSYTEATHAGADAEATNDGEATKKRSRAGTPATPSPRRKRVMCDESPTVYASSTSDSTPKPPSYDLKDDSQAAAIKHAVKQHLPSILAEMFPHHTSSNPPPPLPCPPKSSDPPPSLTAICKRIALETLADSRSHLDTDFYEAWESQMLELSAIKDEHIQELEKRVTSLSEDVDKLAQDKVCDVEDVLDMMADESLRDVQRRLRLLEQFRFRRAVRAVVGEGGEGWLRGDWRARRRGKGGYRNVGTRGVR